MIFTDISWNKNENPPLIFYTIRQNRISLQRSKIIGHNLSQI